MIYSHFGAIPERNGRTLFVTSCVLHAVNST